MATSSSDSIFGLGVTQIAIPTGNTLAILVQGIAGQNSMMFRNVTGGTLLNLGIGANGATYTAAQMVSIGASGAYICTTAEYSIDGPAMFYLAAPGATQVVCVAFGKTAGA